MNEPQEGRWYWILVYGFGWSIARRDRNAAGGWTNADTWEDFDNEVKRWILFPLPNELEP